MAGVFHRHDQRVVEFAGGGEAMNQAFVVATDPVAAIGVDRRAVGTTQVLVHVDEQAAIARRAAVSVVIERPDLLHAGVRVGQVHDLAVGAERQAVGDDEILELRVQRGLAGAVAI